MITDKEAVMAQRIVVEYCNDHVRCETCVFKTPSGCNMHDIAPDCWEVPTDADMEERHERQNEANEVTATCPSHYDGDVQPIELMKAQMSTEKFLGFLLGNIIKYASRFGKNGKAMSDAKKIRQYAEWLVQMTEHGEIEVVSHEKNEAIGEAQA